MRVPKHYEQKLRISALIEGAEAGTMLPPERELAERFGTSRTTIRLALGALVAEGRLDRVQGRGTFVAGPKLVQLRQLTSLSDDLAGERLGGRVVSLDSLGADAAVAAGLGIPIGAPVHRLERVRLRAPGADDGSAEGEPLAHEVAYLPGSLAGFPREFAARGALYRTLREAYGREATAAEDEIETALAAPDEAALLAVEVGAPLLVVRRTAWDGSGEAIEWTRSVFRGDRFRFLARVGVRAEG